LNFGAGAWGDDAREHFNPFFGGYSADKMAGGPGVKLRAKGDSDVKEKPKKYQGGTQTVGKPNYWPGGAPPSVPEQMPGFAGPPEQMPYGWKQHQRNLGNLGGGGGFYPQGQGFAGGTSEVGIGDPNPQAVGANYKMPELSGQNLGPLMAAIKAEAQKQGLNASQISSILGAFKGVGGGGGMTSYGEGSSVSNALGPALENAFAGGYQGGISDIGYPPFLMPNAEYHADKGSSWVGPYDPAYLVQRYARGTSNVW
jgi:hypothetical protein